MGKKLTLVLGGARSGKSNYAQSILQATGQPVLFVATATAGDDEMKARIAAHQASRPQQWVTLEAPLHVGEAIRQAESTPYVLIDCLTLLASNVLMGLPEPVDDAVYMKAMQDELDGILAVYRQHSGEWFIVSNEVGLGLVPAYPMGRSYRDVLGKANQILAQQADRVVFMVAGIPMMVKGETGRK